MQRKIDNRIPQMFDVRPVQSDGSLDLERIQNLKDTVNLKEEASSLVFDVKDFDLYENIYTENTASDFLPKNVPSQENFSLDKLYNQLEEDYFENSKEEIFSENFSTDLYDSKDGTFGEKTNRINDFLKNNFAKFSFSLAGAALAIFLGFFGVTFIQKGLNLKTLLIKDGQNGYANLAQAKENILNENFSQSTLQFQEAYENFNSISSEISGFSGVLADVGRFIPFLSKISSGKYLAEAGKDISQIGIISGQVIEQLNGLKNPLNNEGKSISLLRVFQDVDANTKKITNLLDNVEKNVQKIDVEDIPEKQRVKFIELKDKLPQIKNLAEGFSSNSDIIKDVLGGNGPRKYLFLFQNNQEMRATGGFIGSYGVLDIFDGHVKKFFIDGIFNPDGQLKEKIIPPFPIQKISAAWSLHDSNWFPDFPVSAEKAAWFYEKTGGPTVDGVITMTPTVMQKLLEVTGPIEMPDYNMTINANNFLENIQQEVEVDYDKQLNQPKKILSDLAPIMLDRIFNARNFSDISKIGKILQESLKEKQVLIYSKNYEIERKIASLGWSGEIIKTEKDYLSVINSNINGFKTDGVIDEKIEINSEIQEDGSIIDQVTITRKHNGGNLKFDWWNKVNADYMRVYVPKGSQLISAEGQTREFNSPPLDYKALNFKHDSQVEQEEENIEIDQKNGTRIYQDSGKTVFANWVYVSPQETVVVKYKYLLPFKVSIDEKEKNVGTYSLVAQKQSGSIGSKFVATIKYPSYYNVIWKYPEECKQETGKTILESDLVSDKFIGIAFSK